MSKLRGTRCLSISVRPIAIALAVAIGFLVAPAVVHAQERTDAVVLVNSAGGSYAQFQERVQPYLDNFGVPYSVLDVATSPVGVDVGDYAVILIGHPGLDPDELYLDATEEGYLSDAVNGGTGLVSFDNDLSADGIAARYQFVTDIFGFTYGAATSGSGVTIANPASHYIVERHTDGESIGTGTMSLAGIAGGGTALASTAGQPFLAVASHGAGRAVQWGSIDWMSHAVKGPLFGFDDLVWRSIVWAARKPFVMQGMPPFVTLRVDDDFGDLTWLQIANTFGFKPWVGVFIDEYTTAEAEILSDLVYAGQATASIHAFSTGSFFYFDHAGSNWDDTTLATHFTQGTQWHTTHDVPISDFVLGHYYEVGSNAFQGLSDWGVEFIGIPMEPGQSYGGASWLEQAPYRLYESGSANDQGGGAHPFFYADYMTIPGHPEFDGQFFNCFTEIRDVTGYEWYPSNDVGLSVERGTEWLTRPLDSMALSTLFTHGYEIYPITQANWTAIMQGIADNLTSYDPLYVTLDDACRYVRAVYDSDITASEHDTVLDRVTVTLGGQTDTETVSYTHLTLPTN